MITNKESHHRSFKISILFRLALLLSVCLSSICLSYTRDDVVEEYGQLSVKGNHIVDEDGESVVLRGMSLHWSQWAGQFYNADVVKWLHDDWNCTVVRASMAIEASGYLTNSEREKQKVETVVQAAINDGMYVIIDWHDHNADKHIPQAQAFFEEMAKTYGKYPNIIYEIWNEPLDIHDWDTIIKPYHEAVIPKIRAHDPNNIIVCGTQSWSQDVDKASKSLLKFNNIAYSLHFYAASHKQSLRDKAAAALDNGVALMVTEWGTSDATGNGKLDKEETKKWLKFMDKNELSWCNWSITDKQETSAALKPNADPNGGWSANSISASGTFVRQELRKYNSPDVIYVPTPQEVVEKMLEMAQVTKDDLVYDLGCGDGRIVVTAAKKYGCRGVGYDVDPKRIEESLENVRKNDVGDLVTIEQKDIFTLDLSDANVITLYLLPSLNVKLIPQLEKLRPGSRIVSHDFDMRGVKPDQVFTMTPESSYREHKIYLWTTPLKKEQTDDSDLY